MADDFKVVAEGDIPSDSKVVAEGDIPPFQQISTDEEARQVSEELSKELQQITNKDQVKLESETKIASEAQRRVEAGSMWKAFVKDPEGALMQTMEKLFPGNPAIAGAARDLLNGMKSGQYDPQSSLAAYSDPYTPAAYSGPTVIAGGTTADPVSSLGLARSGKKIDGPTQCAREAVVGLVGAVARYVVGAIDTQTGAVSSAHQFMASLGAATSDLPTFLMTLPVNLLTLLLTDKATLLDDIEARALSVAKLVGEMRSDDYGYDHRGILLKALAFLQSADTDLEDAERSLLGGAGFQSAPWDRAKNNIDDAGDTLSRAEFNAGAGSRQVRIVAELWRLNSLIQVLLCRQDLIERLYTNLSTYESDYQASAKYDNLNAPLIDQVRCMLKQLIGEISQSLSSGSVASLFAKEQKWCSEIQVLLAHMVGAAYLQAVVPAPAGGYGGGMSQSLEENAEEWNDPNDFTLLTGLLDYLASTARSVLFRQVDVADLVANMVVAIQREIVKQKASMTEIEKQLSSFSSSFGESAGEALAITDSVVSFLSTRDLGGMLEALQMGDIKKFFSSVRRDSTKQESALDKVARLIIYRKQQTGRIDKDLLAVYDELLSRVRADQTFKGLTTGAADVFIRETKEITIPRNNRMVRAAQRFNTRLQRGLSKASAVESRINAAYGKVNAVIDGIDNVATKIEGVLARATQKRSVSCAAR